jgi:hypothetical protein
MKMSPFCFSGSHLENGNSAWGSVLALFYFKTKSPKDITIRPVEGRDVVSELTECANAGESSQEGRGFSPQTKKAEFFST